MAKTSNAPGQKYVEFTLGTALTEAVRSIRFDAAGQVTILDAQTGSTPSSTLTVVAGEYWSGVNIIKVTSAGTGYTGVVSGWT